MRKMIFMLSFILVSFAFFVDADEKKKSEMEKCVDAAEDFVLYEKGQAPFKNSENPQEAIKFAMDIFIWTEASKKFPNVDMDTCHQSALKRFLNKDENRYIVKGSH